MNVICNDNRFELINKYKQKLIEGTNIESSSDEMAVLDNILFRFWQMGWLDRLEEPEQKHGRWRIVSPESYRVRAYRCSECNELIYGKTNYCPNCGSYNGGEQDDD